MRILDVFWIEILRKIGSVRKVANANKPIKTNGFLMISWFARFKNRFGKLQKNMNKSIEKVMQKTLENHQKSHPKSMPKPSKNHQKIDAEKNIEKKRHFLQNPGIPGRTLSPTNTTKVNKTHSPSHTQTQ